MHQILACADPTHRDEILYPEDWAFTAKEPVLKCPHGCRFPVLDHGIIKAVLAEPPDHYGNPLIFESKADRIITSGLDNPTRPLLLKEIINRGGRAIVVDLGSGIGKELSFAGLAIKGGCGQLIGVDLSLKMAIATAQRLNQEVPWLSNTIVWADASEVPLLSCSVDVVIMKQLLNRASNWQNILREAYRILRRGGTLIVQVPSTNHYLHMSIPRLDQEVPLPHLGDDMTHPEGRGFTAEQLLVASKELGIVASINRFQFYHGAFSLGEALKFLSAKGYSTPSIDARMWAVVDLPIGILFPGEYLVLRAVKP